jgi:hypothetical protein
VLAETAGRLAATIKARNDLALHVDHLTSGVDAQPARVSCTTGVAQAA